MSEEVSMFNNNDVLVKANSRRMKRNTFLKKMYKKVNHVCSMHLTIGRLIKKDKAKTAVRIILKLVIFT